MFRGIAQRMTALWRALVAWIGSPGDWVNFRKLRTYVLWGFLAYTAIGFLAVPPLAKWQIRTALEERYERPVQFERLRINPFLMSVDAQGFAITEPTGESLVGFDRLFVRLRLSGILKWAWSFKVIRLEGATANLVRQSATETNFNVFFPPPDPEDVQDDAEPIRLIIGELDIRDAAATFTDQTRPTPFVTELGPMNATVRELSTLPGDASNDELVIVAEDNTRVEWSGDLSLSPFGSWGRVTGSGSYIPLVYRYFQDDVLFETPESQSDWSFDYVVETRDAGGLAFDVSDLSLSLEDLTVRSPSPAVDVVTLPELRIDGGAFSWPEQTVSASAVTLTGVQLDTWRDESGALFIDALIDPDTMGGQPDAAANGDSSAMDDWSISIDEFAIRDLSGRFEDRLPGEPVDLALADMDVVVKNITNQAGASMPLEATATLKSGGQATLNGAITVLPEPSATVQATGEGLVITPLQAYLREFLNIELDDGAVSFTVDVAAQNPQSITAKGAGKITAFSLRETGGDDPLVAWSEVAADQFEFSSSDQSLVISQIDIVEPFAKLIINEDLTTNIQQLLITQPDDATAADAAPDEVQVEDAPATGNEASDESAITVTIGRIRVTEGSADFADRSLPLPFSTNITSLDGEVTTLAQASSDPSRITLEGQVGEFGLAQVNGALTPFDPTQNTDINVLFRNIEISSWSPYTIKFAGREIARGAMDLNLEYIIDQGLLQGENNAVIRDIELGEQVDYPGAANLPLGLAIALLKDADGTIDVDIPVRGDVNDPEFQMGGVIRKAIFNLITGIVTSPFRLLGNLVGAEDADLDQIEFQPGSAELTPPEVEKLTKLSEALTLRPNLVLQIGGTYATELDQAALRTQRLDQRIETEIEARRAGGGDEVLTTLRRQVVEAMFVQRFPDEPLDSLQSSFLQPPTEDSRNARPVLDEQAYVNGLRDRLLAVEPVSDADLAQLAEQRADAIATQLLVEGSIATDRIQRVDLKSVEATDREWVPVKLDVTN